MVIQKQDQVERFAPSRSHIVMCYRPVPVAVMSHFPCNFRIIYGSRHLGVPKYIGFICSIDQNVSCITGKRLYSFNSIRSNHISSDSTHTRSIVLTEIAIEAANAK